MDKMVTSTFCNTPKAFNSGILRFHSAFAALLSQSGISGRFGSKSASGRSLPRHDPRSFNIGVGVGFGPRLPMSSPFKVKTREKNSRDGNTVYGCRSFLSFYPPPHDVWTTFSGQHQLFPEPDQEKHKKLDEAFDKIRSKFGHDALRRGK
jgi:hypothetical protein